jgi:hypothetical protein
MRAARAAVFCVHARHIPRPPEHLSLDTTRCPRSPSLPHTPPPRYWACNEWRGTGRREITGWIARRCDIASRTNQMPIVEEGEHVGVDGRSIARIESARNRYDEEDQPEVGRRFPQLSLRPSLSSRWWQARAYLCARARTAHGLGYWPRLKAGSSFPIDD